MCSGELPSAASCERLLPLPQELLPGALLCAPAACAPCAAAPAPCAAPGPGALRSGRLCRPALASRAASRRAAVRVCWSVCVSVAAAAQELLPGLLRSGCLRSVCGGSGPLCGSGPGALRSGRLCRSVLLRVVRSGELPSASPAVVAAAAVQRRAPAAPPALRPLAVVLVRLRPLRLPP